jgi:exosortase O
MDARAHTDSAPGLRAPALRGPITSALFVAAWLRLGLHTMGWIARSFASETERTGRVLLLAALALVLVSARSHGPRLARALLDGPRLRPLPLIVLLACTAGLLGRERLFHLNILSAVFFGLGSWAFAGLYLPSSAFRRTLPLALLLVALLPFGTHLDVFVGFPARVATARIVAACLSAVGVPSLPTESILVLDHGIADVDLPCSGVKSLWAGALLLFAATFLDGRRMRGRWLALAALYGLLLLAANALRVLCLVLLHFVARESAVARIAHLPLGVLGFVAASAAMLALLARLPRCPSESESVRHKAVPWPVAALAAALSILASPSSGVASSAPPKLPTLHIALPSELQPSSLPLTAAEARLDALPDGPRAEKWRFAWKGHSGSLLVMSGGSFRVQHAPEVCLAAAGHSVDEIHEPAASDPIPCRYRWLVLDGGRRSAVYWFQSPTLTTPRLLERAVAEVSGRQRAWALVSILFDQRIDPADEIARELLERIHASVAMRQQGDEP